MNRYCEVVTQEDMDRLLASIMNFHDSMTREVHMLSRGFVSPDHSMMCPTSIDAQVLIQSQWDPFAVELVFIDIKSFVLNDPGEYWGASGRVELKTTPVEKLQVSMHFDNSLRIVSSGLHYRVRSEWLGNRSFLGPEIPSGETIRAIHLQEKWRQCSKCSDAWEEDRNVEFSRCPSCEAVTQLEEDALCS